MKNETFRTNIGYELDRVFDVDDTYDNHDFFESISQLKDEYFSNREENEDVSNLAESVGLWISDVENGEMSEAAFVSSIYEFLEGDDW